MAGLLLVVILVGAGVGFLAGTTSAGATFTLTSATTTTTTIAKTTVETFTVASSTTVTLTANPAANPLTFSSTLVTKVPLGGTDIAVDDAAKEIFVVSAGSPIVTIVNSTSEVISATILLPENSTGSVAIGDGVAYFPLSGPNHYVYAFDEVAGGGRLISAKIAEVAYANGAIYGTGADSVAAINVTTDAVMWNASIGYGAYQIQVNPSRGVVYALGCAQFGLACGSEISFLNASSGTMVYQDMPGSAYYATMTVDEATGWVYVSGGAQLVAYGPMGGTIYKSNPLTCGPFIGMAADSASNQVVLAPQNYNYLLFYDGTSLSLLNMYAIPSSPQLVGQNMAFSLDSGYLYVLLPGEGLAVLRGSEPAGHMNSSLIAPSFPNCLPV